MFERLAQQWVYGGFLAAWVLFALAPFLDPALGFSAFLVYLALPVYMIHQFEEHDDDRFRGFINDDFMPNRRGLTTGDVFVINIAGVWLVLVGDLWLSVAVDPGWGLIAAYLLLINALAHLGQGIALRRYNPGLITALASMAPLGLWILLELGATATPLQHLVAAGFVMALHGAIVVRAWPLKA